MSAVLATLSGSYPPLRGRSPTCYSAVRHYHPPEGGQPFDLHVLGTPPAFILSQDQTLHRNCRSHPSFTLSGSKWHVPPTISQQIVTLPTTLRLSTCSACRRAGSSPSLKRGRTSYLSRTPSVKRWATLG